jgi:hypothetical protein
MTGSESEGDRRAALTTSSWQQAAVAQFGGLVVPEFSIGVTLVPFADSSELGCRGFCGPEFLTA